MRKVRRVKTSRIIVLLFVILVVVSVGVAGISRLFFYDDSYDLSKFVNQDGYMYYNDDKYESIFGIDVSSHQKEIDWTEVANSNIKFAMIRCGYRGGIEGKQHIDEYFDTNMQQAQQNGIQTGVYFYSSAITMEELEEDANLVLELMKNHDVQYPVVFDMEIYDEVNGRINHLTKEEKTSFALRFCEIMEENGYQSMIYGNLDWLYNHLNFEEIKKYELWYAAYLSTPVMQDRFRMWQYTNEGSVSGISTNVDMNVWIQKR